MSSAPAAAAAPFVPQWTFADKIRKARQISGMDQRAFAEALELSSGAIASYETGRSTPRFRDVGQVARRIQLLTGISYQWFLDDGLAVGTNAAQMSPRQDSNLRQTDYKVGGGELIHVDFARLVLKESA